MFFFPLGGVEQTIHSDFQQDFRAHRESSKLFKMPHKKRSHAHHKHSKEEKEVSFSLSMHVGHERMLQLQELLTEANDLQSWLHVKQQLLHNHDFVFFSISSGFQRVSQKPRRV